MGSALDDRSYSDSIRRGIVKPDIESAISTLKTRSQFVADVNLNAQVAYKLAIESLEKQLPFKIGIHNSCRRCGAGLYSMFRIYNGLPNYCGRCGQALDWIDNE